jgi:uncharacterized protein YbjT (DUF2867 family)
MNNKQILTDAYKLLRDTGFCKGQEVFRDDDGRALAYCALGAIYYASRPHSYDFYQAMGILLDVINDSSVPVWNDAPERTRQEVLSAFLEAIEVAEKEVCSKK